MTSSVINILAKIVKALSSYHSNLERGIKYFCLWLVIAGEL